MGIFLGKLDSLEWDSGARDLSPVARPGDKILHNHTSSGIGSAMEQLYKVGHSFNFFQ